MVSSFFYHCLKSYFFSCCFLAVSIKVKSSDSNAYVPGHVLVFGADMARMQQRLCDHMRQRTRSLVATPKDQSLLATEHPIVRERRALARQAKSSTDVRLRRSRDQPMRRNRSFGHLNRPQQKTSGRFSTTSTNARSSLRQQPSRKFSLQIVPDLHQLPEIQVCDGPDVERRSHSQPATAAPFQHQDSPELGSSTTNLGRVGINGPANDSSDDGESQPQRGQSPELDRHLTQVEGLHPHAVAFPMGVKRASPILRRKSPPRMGADQLSSDSEELEP